jgi:hypothetical protein
MVVENLPSKCKAPSLNTSTTSEVAILHIDIRDRKQPKNSWTPHLNFINPLLFRAAYIVGNQIITLPFIFFICLCVIQTDVIIIKSI